MIDDELEYDINSMVEIATFHFVINTQIGGEHFFSHQDDTELVNMFVNELTNFINEMDSHAIRIGKVRYRRGCLEIIVQLLVDLGKDFGEQAYHLVEILANIGGAYGFILLIHDRYKSIKLRYKGRDLTGTVKNKEVKPEDQLINELYRVAHKNGLSKRDIMKLIKEQAKAKRKRDV